MRDPFRYLQRAIGINRLTSLTLGGRRLPAHLDGIGPRTVGSPIEGYVSVVFQALAVFRFLSFAMGAGLLFSLNPTDLPPIGIGLMVGVVGLYNMARVILRFDPWAYNPVIGWLSLASDVVLAVGLVHMTGALDSPFLIYSLAPILTASLVMNLRSALAAAGLSAIAVVGRYVIAGFGVESYAWILDGNYLAFSLLYLAVCVVIAYLPFLANLNWQRRVRGDLVADERGRLRREVHDNVAQTLAFLSLKVKRAEERASSATSALTTRDAFEIGSMVERAYLAVRDYLDETHDEEIVEPLAISLAIVARQWMRDTGLPVQMNLAETEDDLSPEVKLQFLQITREALANVAKHANPNQVWVEMENVSDGVAVHVRDDGRGFSSSQPRGHGLQIMKERAELAGASLVVESVPGEGTEVRVARSRSTQEGQS